MSLKWTMFVTKLGALADADSTPTMSDPTGAFGVRRISDGVVMVAAGTAMTRESLGVYSYTFSGAVAGVPYEYAIRAVVDGAVRYLQEPSTLTVVSSMSYLTLSDADAIAATLPLLDAYNAASTTAKQKALELASYRFDLARPYQGRKYEFDQQLEFPRIPRGTLSTQNMMLPPAQRINSLFEVWDWDSTNNEAIVPALVKRAVLFEANSILAADRDRIVAAIHNGLVSQSVGSVSESYRNYAAGETKPVLCSDAELVSLKYARTTGEML
jgi:hypothetical protein